jgi:hypothetical protein
MDYDDLVTNAKKLNKTIFDLTDEDFKNSKLVLVSQLVILGNNKGARCLINKNGTTSLNKLAEKEVETWLRNIKSEETNWMCPVERVIKALGGHVIRYN